MDDDKRGQDSSGDWPETALLAQAFEVAPDAQLLVDADGCIVRANRQCEELFGYPDAELVGLSVESLIPGRFVHRHALYRKSFMDAPRARPMGEDVALYALRKDGVEVPVSIMLSSLDTSKGRVALAVVRDMTAREKADEKFRGLLESAPDAMVIVDEQGMIQLVNSRTEQVFGYPRTELLGRAVEMLIPDRYRQRHTEHRAGYFQQPRFRGMGQGLELYGQRRNGEQFPIEISLSPLHTEDGLLVSSAIRDITDRKRVEAKLRTSLEEKETLLKEVHHRVKNNLAVIASTFYLQSTYVDDPQVVEMLQNCQDRVRSMALVHERLYHSGNFAAVDFAEYTRELCSELLTTYTVGSEQVQLDINIEQVRVGLNQAIPCALILNELVSNSLKHAFPRGAPGKLSIAIQSASQGKFQLTVRDNGVGMPPDRSVASVTGGTFGMRLVDTLTRQVDGKLEFLPGNPGTIATLSFSANDQV